MDSLFADISSFQARTGPSKPTRNIDQDIAEIYALFAANPEPAGFVESLIRFIAEKKITYSYRHPRFISYLEEPQRREKNFLKRYNVVEINRETPNVYHNVFPYQLRDQQDSGEITLCTYLIDSYGLHLGLYENIFEIGTGHKFLSPDRSGEVFVLVAGEILIQDNQLIYNFESGSYMEKYFSGNSFPLFKQFLIEAVGLILGRSTVARPFSTVEFTTESLFPKRDFPLVSNLRYHLTRNPDLTIMDEQKEDIRNVIYFNDVAGAQVYFSRHPYQQVMIEQDGIVYTNPDPSQPTLFVDRNSMFSGMRKRKSKSRKSSSRRRCWRGYEKRGTKWKNGRRVNNCVKK
jgi:hypothetical protein